MRQQLSLLLVFLITTTISCKHPDTDNNLNRREKELVMKIINDLEKSKGTSSFEGESAYYKYLVLLLNRPTFQPIPVAEADALGKAYDVKRSYMEQHYGGGNAMRPNPITHISSEAQRVWIPVDQFQAFYDDLLAMEANDHKTTGFEIYFGSYPHDLAKDQPDQNGNYPNGDLYSGRTTLFFLGTEDINISDKDYNVKNQKEIPAFIQGIGMATPASKVYNHGSLCPDSCAIK